MSISRSAPSCASNNMSRPVFAAQPRYSPVSHMKGSSGEPNLSSHASVSATPTGCDLYAPAIVRFFHSSRFVIFSRSVPGDSRSPVLMPFFIYLSEYTGAMPRFVEPYFLSPSRSSSRISSRRWKGKQIIALSLILRLSGVIIMPDSVNLRISPCRCSISTTMPLPITFMVFSRNMPDGSRFNMNLPRLLTTV